MAIVPETQYAGKIAPATTEYPYGQARNITLPGDGTGTPWEAALVNDIFGFQQALLSAANLTPTGDPETAILSQYYQALNVVKPSNVADMSVLADESVGGVLKKDQLIDGQLYFIPTYHPDGTRGGGVFKYSASTATTAHNGGTIRSVTVPWDGTPTGLADFLAGVGETAPAGTGAMVRVTDEISAHVFGALGDGVAIDTEAVHAYRDAFPGRILSFLPGTYRGNFVLDNNTRILGAGQNATKLVADSTASPVVTFADATAIEQYYLNGRGFMIDGEGTAAVGLRLGFPDQTQSVSYGSYQDIEVKNCTNNIEMNRVIGFSMQNVYSHTASESALLIPINDIITTGSFVNCQFRQSKTNLELRGGAILNFRACVIESAKDLGLLFQKATTSGVRQCRFDTCWFENNGHTPVTTISGGLYIDMTSTLGDADHPSGLTFVNTVISSAAGEPDLRLNRGAQIEFDRCTFKEFTAANLVVPSAQYTFALLRNCGTINEAPNPTLYANFPARTLSGDKYLGLAYEYEYGGNRYTNFAGRIARPAATVSSFDVKGVTVLAVDTSAGNVEITSLSGGFDGQEVSIIKPSGPNSIVIPHNGAGDEPIFTPNAATRTLSGRAGARIVFQAGTWYFAGQ